VIYEHPQYQGPIILDVLPDELGELPESERYVSIEVIQPGDRSGQKALISLDRFNKLTADMNTIVMNAVAAQASPTASEAKRRPRRSGISGQRGKVNYASWSTPASPTVAGSPKPRRTWCATTWSRSTSGYASPDSGRSILPIPPCGIAMGSNRRPRTAPAGHR
jgi:hypothetical protein